MFPFAPRQNRSVPRVPKPVRTALPTDNPRPARFSYPTHSVEEERNIRRRMDTGRARYPRPIYRRTQIANSTSAVPTPTQHEEIDHVAAIRSAPPEPVYPIQINTEREEEENETEELSLFSLFSPPNSEQVNPPIRKGEKDQDIDNERLVIQLRTEKKELEKSLQWQIDTLERKLTHIQRYEALLERIDESEVNNLSLEECQNFKEKARKLLTLLEDHETKLFRQKMKKDCYEELYFCLICQENERDVCFDPCSHFCLCRSCVETKKVTVCPICRTTINGGRTIFLS